MQEGRKPGSLSDQLENFIRIGSRFPAVHVKGMKAYKRLREKILDDLQYREKVGGRLFILIKKELESNEDGENRSVILSVLEKMNSFNRGRKPDLNPLELYDYFAKYERYIEERQLVIDAFRGGEGLSS